MRIWFHENDCSRADIPGTITLDGDRGAPGSPVNASPTASEKCARPPPLHPRPLPQPQIYLDMKGMQLTSTRHLPGSCARSFVHARSAKRPSLVAADALDSPSGESWCAKLGAEQAQVSATSIRKSCRETVVVSVFAGARHHRETAWSIHFSIICF